VPKEHTSLHFRYGLFEALDDSRSLIQNIMRCLLRVIGSIQSFEADCRLQKYKNSGIWLYVHRKYVCVLESHVSSRDNRLRSSQLQKKESAYMSLLQFLGGDDSYLGCKSEL
jgi:hypothetical protein